MLNTQDLQRVCAEKAAAVLVLCNKFSTDPSKTNRPTNQGTTGQKIFKYIGDLRKHTNHCIGTYKTTHPDTTSLIHKYQSNMSLVIPIKYTSGNNQIHHLQQSNTPLVPIKCTTGANPITFGANPPPVVPICTRRYKSPGGSNWQIMVLQF